MIHSSATSGRTAKEDYPVLPRLSGVAESPSGRGRTLHSITVGEIVDSPLSHFSNPAEFAEKTHRARLQAGPFPGTVTQGAILLILCIINVFALCG